MRLIFSMVLAYDDMKIYNSTCYECLHHKYREDVDAHMCTANERGAEELISSLNIKGYFDCHKIKVNNDVKRDLKKL